jgi:hypothetical protein
MAALRTRQRCSCIGDAVYRAMMQEFRRNPVMFVCANKGGFTSADRWTQYTATLRSIETLLGRCCTGRMVRYVVTDVSLQWRVAH